MTEYFAFIDESGNNALDTKKEGATKYFVLAAVICDFDSLEKLNKLAVKISNDFYGGKEIKSNKNKGERRLNIIKLLLENDVKFSAMVINKDEIYKDSALDYKKVFIKYINKLFYSQLVVHHQPLKIFADKHGGDEFSSSFIKYLNNEFKDQLFSPISVHHVDSNVEKIIQIADLISGTVRIFYEGQDDYLKDGFLEYKKKCCLFFDEWPLVYSRGKHADSSSCEKDALVSELSISLAQDFKLKNSGTADEYTQIQVALIGHLLFNAVYNENKYLVLPEIKRYINSQGFSEISDQQFRSLVIARLRDSGVIIASSSEGYKIPTKYKDMIDFVEMVDGQVIPLLERLARARTLIKARSMGDFDLLDEERYSKLRKVFDVFL